MVIAVSENSLRAAHPIMNGYFMVSKVSLIKYLQSHYSQNLTHRHHSRKQKESGYFQPDSYLCRGPDLNRGPTHFQCVALPTELPRHPRCRLDNVENSISERLLNCKSQSIVTMKTILLSY